MYASNYLAYHLLTSPVYFTILYLSILKVGHFSIRFISILSLMDNIIVIKNWLITTLSLESMIGIVFLLLCTFFILSLIFRYVSYFFTIVVFFLFAFFIVFLGYYSYQYFFLSHQEKPVVLQKILLTE